MYHILCNLFMESQEDRGQEEDYSINDSTIFLNQENVIIPLQMGISSLNQQNQQNQFVFVLPVPVNEVPISLPVLDQHPEQENQMEDNALPSENPARVVRRSHPSEEEQPHKKQKIAQEGPNNDSESPTSFMLRTRELLHLTVDEPTNILLTSSTEPNLLIRKIIAGIPKGVANRLTYLYKFIQKLPMEEEESTHYHDDIRDKVLSAFMKEYKLRFLFKKVINRWRVRNMNKNSEEEVDPITLCPPEKGVALYDWTFKRRFLFEANTLALLIESKLMYHEGGFPVPMYPKSPRNNVEFTYPQLISIYYQLKAHGELMWGLTTLRQCNFNKKRWYQYHKSAITIGAIKNSISLLDTRDGIDLLSDFIFAKMEELRFQLTRYVMDAYIQAMVRVPNHWYLEKCKFIAMVHYEAEHFGENRTRFIESACFKLFRKQNQFIKELKSMNIIR